MKATTTTLQPLYKYAFPNGVEPKLFKQCKLPSLMKKDTSCERERKVPIEYAPTGGGSASYDEASENKRSNTFAEFAVTRKKDYSLGSIDGEAIAASKAAKDRGILVDALANNLKSAHYTFSRSYGINCFGDGTGKRGAIGSTTVLTSTSLVLETRADMVNFEVGMWVQFYDPAGPTLRDGGKKLRITAISRGGATATLTLSAAINTVSGVALADGIVRAGDLNAVPQGVRAWITDSAPTATLFNGIDRTNDTERLGGIRVTGSGKVKSETLIDAAAECALFGGSPDYCGVNPLDFAPLQKELGTGAMVDVEGSRERGRMGFKALEFWVGTGPVKIVPEIDVPKGRFLLLTTESWTIGSALQVPHILNGDQVGRLLREYADDAYEFRWGAYYNYWTDAPAHNVNGSW